MGRKTMLECNCGCGKKAEKESEQAGWLELKQIKEIGEQLPKSAPKLDQCLCFASLDCLQRWTEAAILDLPKLQRHEAACLTPRGSLCSREAPGLYI